MCLHCSREKFHVSRPARLRKQPKYLQQNGHLLIECLFRNIKRSYYSSELPGMLPQTLISIHYQYVTYKIIEIKRRCYRSCNSTVQVNQTTPGRRTTC